MASLVSPMMFRLLRYLFFCGLESTISMSMLWSSPGPTMAVTMTSSLSCTWFHTHFDGGKRYDWRENFIAEAGKSKRERVTNRWNSEWWPCRSRGRMIEALGRAVSQLYNFKSFNTMADAGFFKGTSTDQDRRFSDKETKLLKTMKFPATFDKKVR